MATQASRAFPASWWDLGLGEDPCAAGAQAHTKPKGQRAPHHLQQQWDSCISSRAAQAWWAGPEERGALPSPGNVLLWQVQTAPGSVLVPGLQSLLLLPQVSYEQKKLLFLHTAAFTITRTVFKVGRGLDWYD